MKYQVQTSVEASPELVMQSLISKENLAKWQEGLLSHDMIRGNYGEVGSESALVFEGRKGSLEMTETVLSRTDPGLWIVRYRSRGVINDVKNEFLLQEDGTTLWKATHVFRFRGMMSLMAPFMKTAFQANTQLTMERFRAFVLERVHSKN
ncbi:MAG: hypothetical protein R2751_18035 [Bacteroidales bacterium]